MLYGKLIASEIRWKLDSFYSHVTGYKYLNLKMLHLAVEQSGAVEACWAHNPEVRGSKPRSANCFAVGNFSQTGC